MKQKIGTILVGIFSLALVVGIAWGQTTPQLINYQGRLTDGAGHPPADGATVDLTFAFYGVETGGTAYLTIVQEDVVVNGGLYNVFIGSGTVVAGSEPNLGAVFQNHQDVWMGVTVDTDDEMTPRTRITSVPYAMKLDAGWWTGFYNKSDYDGDGYSKVIDGATATTDCNDGDASINPGAAEVCDDGLDNDCDGDIDGADLDCINVPPGMALIPAGCFAMGDSLNEGGPDELPVHNVCITSSFFMDVHEVTNGSYAACVSGGGCTAPAESSSYTRDPYYGNTDYDSFPVFYVSWDQAAAYCAWAGKRLPTEAEWEYSARGGLSGNSYPWGNTISGADANYWDSGDPWDNDTSEVGYYAANGYGLYDMAGNVAEWVNDWYQSDYYSVSPTNDPAGPASGTTRVVRSGGWNSNLLTLRAAGRYGATPTDQNFSIGFRCAAD